MRCRSYHCLSSSVGSANVLPKKKPSSPAVIRGPRCRPVFRALVRAPPTRFSVSHRSQSLRHQVRSSSLSVSTTALTPNGEGVSVSYIPQTPFSRYGRYK